MVPRARGTMALGWGTMDMSTEHVKGLLVSKIINSATRKNKKMNI